MRRPSQSPSQREVRVLLTSTGRRRVGAITNTTNSQIHFQLEVGVHHLLFGLPALLLPATPRQDPLSALPARLRLSSCPAPRQARPVVLRRQGEQVVLEPAVLLLPLRVSPPPSSPDPPATPAPPPSVLRGPPPLMSTSLGPPPRALPPALALEMPLAVAAVEASSCDKTYQADISGRHIRQTYTAGI